MTEEQHNKDAATASTKATSLDSTIYQSPQEDYHRFKLLGPILPMRMLFDSAFPDRPEQDIVGEVPVQARSVVLTQSTIKAPS